MTYILPGFPDENADGCPDNLMPDPAWPDGVGWPCIEIVVVTQKPSTITADMLADTGPLEVTGALLGAIVLIWAGLALRGRRA
jgi:hypothetical protein